MSDNKLQKADIPLVDIINETKSNPTIQEHQDNEVLDLVQETFRQKFSEEYPELKFTQEEADQIKRYLSNIRKGGPSGSRLICAGDKCDYRHSCVLWQTKVGNGPTAKKDPQTNETYYVQETRAPVGKPCPLETAVVMETSLQLFNYSEIEPYNPIHQNYINELCQLAALEWRTNMLLAYDYHGIVEDVPAAISPAGDVHFKREMNQLIEVLDKISSRRSRILKELTISPEASYKRRIQEGGKDDDSLSRQQAAIREKIKQRGTQDFLDVPDHVKEDGVYKLAEKNDESSKKEEEQE